LAVIHNANGLSFHSRQQKNKGTNKKSVPLEFAHNYSFLSYL